MENSKIKEYHEQRKSELKMLLNSTLMMIEYHNKVLARLADEEKDWVLDMAEFAMEVEAWKLEQKYKKKEK